MTFSTRSILLAALLTSATNVAAVHLKLRGEPSTQNTARASNALYKRDHLSGLTNGNNIDYYTNITLGGGSFKVLIDTGSSDLYVSGTVSNAEDTGKTTSVQYAIGEVEGPIKTASLTFAGYTISDQAFIEVSASSDNPSGEGLIGLGPNSGSEVYSALGSKSSGIAVVDNIFNQNSSSSNYISVLLGRSDDPDDTFPGDLTIGEVITGYENITNQPKVEVTSASSSVGQHWQILLDASGILGPDGEPINVTTAVKDTDNDKQLTAVFDTGYSLPQVPQTVSDWIYGRFEGALFQNFTNLGGPVWTLPCTTEVNVTFKIGGQSYPVHPLDTLMDGLVTSTVNDTKYCVGSFQPISTAASDSYDVILGMSFLRNAYLLINYGDFLEGTSSTADPYVQLLSVTNASGADSFHTDFVNVRLNGVDTTGDQTLSAEPASSGNPVNNDTTDEAESWLEQHKLYLIIAGSVAGGLLLLGLMLMIWRSCRGRNTRGYYGAVGGVSAYSQGGPGWRADVGPRGRSIRDAFARPSYQPLHDPAPSGEDAYRMQSQNYGQGYGQGGYGQGYETEQTHYQSPWDQPQHPPPRYQ